MKHPFNLTLGFCLALICGHLSAVYAEGNTRTVPAWEALNQGNFELAIQHADKCIDEFELAADRDQSELTKKNTPTPPVGKVADGEKQTILERGILNDVATCFFIKGKAAEGLKRYANARKAYEGAARYPHARCWDPQGWFWSPAEAASDRLRRLKDVQ